MPVSSFQPPESRDETIFMAKLCEQAERHDEMVSCIKKAIKQNPELSTEERNLLAVAYKAQIGSRRASWRIVSSIEQKEEMKGNTQHAKLITTYRKMFEKEVGEICDDLIILIEQLLTVAKTPEEQIFYLKHKADYNRYYSEISATDARKEAAYEAYQKAMDLASRSVPPTHPLRLGLALNYSVYTNEILKQQEKGTEIARKAFDQAVPELESLDEEAYKESTLIMQLIRDNMALWAEDSKDVMEREEEID
eukprot:TRINITY_DN14209_c1_g1_i1.p1 TRINITY_DN14209_c1_g1~~TRINITY_DN14209_c1_g1_i1.p1  ORF type:complete len:251 (+),score=75.73 TRINITY_DN14209_c1_g1_i1:64-816(+)